MERRTLSQVDAKMSNNRHLYVLMNHVDHKIKAKYNFDNNISKLEVTMLAK